MAIPARAVRRVRAKRGMTFSNDDKRKNLLRREADAWVRLLASGRATEEDARALQRWCAQGPMHRAAFEDAKRLWRDFGPAGERLIAQSAASAARSARPRMNRRAFLGGMAAAASVAGVALLAEHPLLGGWTPISEWGADYRTATGEQRTVRLREDVVLAMNTQTSIEVQRQDGRIDGVTLLAGEAAIDAMGATGGQFRIASGAGRITAELPAKLEVRRVGESTCVTCLRGRVAVQVGDQQRTLAARYQVDYGENGLETVRAIEPEQISAWRDGVIVFRNTPLPEAIGEINRYRRGRVMLMDKALEGRSVSGRFPITRMDLAITQIQQAFSARVTTLPGDIILLG